MSKNINIAEDFLKKCGITFKAIRKGSPCPIWCEDDKHKHGNCYSIILKRTVAEDLDARWSFNFWNSFNDSQEGKAPTAYDVLACITKDDPGTFENFCDEFGYDPESKQSKKTYKAVEKEWQKVQTFFNQEELEELRDIR